MDTLPPPVFATCEIKLIEQSYAREHNGHCYDLMEKAGAAVFERIMALAPRPKSVWVFCGHGNNGGDGYVVGALLTEHRVPFRLFAVGTPRDGTEAYTACEYFKSLGGKIETELPKGGDEAPEVAVDALLGTGISSAPRAPICEWIQFINRLKCRTVAVDIPSGVAADTGLVPGDAVRAALTVSMIALKPGLLTGDAVDYVGKVECDSLGVDTAPFYGLNVAENEEAPLPVTVRTYEDITDTLPKRDLSCNKGENGKLLIIGGAVGMAGAAIICGLGALRSGAGLVKVATQLSNVPAFNACEPTLMTADINDDKALQQALEWADVVAVGPGLSQGVRAQSILPRLTEMDIPLVYDADALNLLAKAPDFCDNRVLTPHPGEAARLLKCSVDKIAENRPAAAYKLQQRYGGVVLLKGAGTVICNGKRLTIIREGSPAMAVGGMGDLLTGILGSLLGQGLTPYQAAVAAAAIHGRAGKLAGEQGGVNGTLPRDLLKYVRRLCNGQSAV